MENGRQEDQSNLIDIKQADFTSAGQSAGETAPTFLINKEYGGAAAPATAAPAAEAPGIRIIEEQQKSTFNYAFYLAEAEKNAKKRKARKILLGLTVYVVIIVLASSLGIFNFHAEYAVPSDIIVQHYSSRGYNQVEVYTTYDIMMYNSQLYGLGARECHYFENRDDADDYVLVWYFETADQVLEVYYGYSPDPGEVWDYSDNILLVGTQQAVDAYAVTFEEWMNYLEQENA